MLQIHFAFGQLNLPNRFIAVGTELKIDQYAYSGYHVKFIANNTPSFCLKFNTYNAYLDGSGIQIYNNFASYSTMSFSYAESGISIKPGFVLTKDVGINHVTYICAYFDYARVDAQMIIKYYDHLYGNSTKTLHRFYNHYTGEIEFFAGWRFFGGHACLGGSAIIGYLTEGPYLYPGQPNLHSVYYPDNGYGYFHIFLNATISAAISF